MRILFRHEAKWNISKVYQSNVSSHIVEWTDGKDDRRFRLEKN